MGTELTACKYTPPKVHILGSSEALGYKKCLVVFFTRAHKMLSQSHRKIPLLGRETLCRHGNGECFHLENHEGVREAGTGESFPRSLQPAGTTTTNSAYEKQQSCGCRQSVAPAVEGAPFPEAKLEPHKKKIHWRFLVG